MQRRFASLKSVFRTFRIRLAIWNAIVVILTAVITLALLRQGVRWAILHEMDQLLIEDMDEIALAVQDLPPDSIASLQDDLHRKAQGHQHHGWFVQLLDDHDHILWESERIDNSPTPSGPVDRTGPQTRGGFRIAQRAISSDLHGIAAIRVGASMRFLYEDMSRIDRSVLMAACLALVLAPASGYWLANRAVRPITQITQTAARLRPSRLEERLPVRGTGDELDQLAQTVNGLLDRIAVYLQEKRDFLANAAHELRTPLAAIHSSVEVALNSDRSREEYEDLLVEIIDQGASLRTLVNQLLLISETEAERLKSEFSPVQLDDIVARSTDMFRGVAESRNIDLQLDSAKKVAIVGNANLLRQLVNNLIDNAIKYTPANGQVSVELKMESEDKGVVLAISDTGIGIPAADVPRIFDRFFRADLSRTKLSETDGAGLGLSICQAVVSAHAGRIQCESEESVGTRMTVWLPRTKAVELSRIQDEISSSPSQLAANS